MRGLAALLALALLGTSSGAVSGDVAPQAQGAPAAPASTKLTHGRLAVTLDGSSVWVLGRDGAIGRFDLSSGSPIHSAGAGIGGPPHSDIALSADGGTLYALLPQPDSRTTRLEALSTSTGDETGHWDLRGVGRFLAVTSDGARACMVGLKPSTGGNRRPKSADSDWMITVVDLLKGTVFPAVMPGLEPRSVALMQPPGSPAKLLLAGRDRIATYNIDPLRVSAFYRSPGENFVIAAVDAGSVICLLRGSSLVLIDPARRPRAKGRVQLSEDDATMVVALPARGSDLAVSPDGRAAAVLHEDGLGLTFVDISAGRLLKTETLGAPHDLMGRRILGGDGPRLRVVLGSSTNEAGPDRALMTSEIDSPPAPSVAAAPMPPSPPPAAQAHVASDAPASQPAPSENPPVEAEREPVPEPGRSAPPAPPAPPSPAATPLVSAPPPIEKVPEPAPIQPPRSSEQAALTGHLTGDVAAAREVLLFGPGNILKMHSRAVVASDGSFTLPLPPPGSYRVVVSGGPDAHIFTRPEFRTIVVVPDAKGLEGIDFEVRGKIK